MNPKKPRIQHMALANQAYALRTLKDELKSLIVRYGRRDLSSKEHIEATEALYFFISTVNITKD